MALPASLTGRRKGVSFVISFVARSATGEDRWLDLIISPMEDKLGETIGFRGLARDVTERKRFEEALRDSEARYSLLFESTPQPIWVYNEDTLAFLAVNEAATQHLWILARRISLDDDQRYSAARRRHPNA